MVCNTSFTNLSDSRVKTEMAEADVAELVFFDRACGTIRGFGGLFSLCELISAFACEDFCSLPQAEQPAPAPSAAALDLAHCDRSSAPASRHCAQLRRYSMRSRGRWAIRAAARLATSSSAHTAGFSKSHACTHRKAAEEVISLSSCGGSNKHYRESEKARKRELICAPARGSRRGAPPAGGEFCCCAPPALQRAP